MTEKPKKVNRKSATKKAPAKRKAAPAKRTPSTTTTKKKEVVKRKKRLALSGRELGLLIYPPTKTTWVCTCGIYNSGEMKHCWVCHGNRSKNLLWPVYEQACKKVGIEIGSQWKIINKVNNHVVAREPDGRWKIIDLPEGYTL